MITNASFGPTISMILSTILRRIVRAINTQKMGRGFGFKDPQQSIINFWGEGSAKILFSLYACKRKALTFPPMIAEVKIPSFT